MLPAYAHFGRHTCFQDRQFVCRGIGRQFHFAVLDNVEQRVAARQCAGLCRTLADNARHGRGDFRLRALVAAIGELRLQLCNFRAGSLHIRLRRFQTQTLLVQFLRRDRAFVGQRAVAVERGLCFAPFRLPRIQV